MPRANALPPQQCCDGLCGDPPDSDRIQAKSDKYEDNGYRRTERPGADLHLCEKWGLLQPLKQRVKYSSRKHQQKTARDDIQRPAE